MEEQEIDGLITRIKDSGLTQTSLAEEADVSERTIRSLIKNRTCRRSTYKLIDQALKGRQKKRVQAKRKRIPTPTKTN